MFEKRNVYLLLWKKYRYQWFFAPGLLAHLNCQNNKEIRTLILFVLYLPTWKKKVSRSCIEWIYTSQSFLKALKKLLVKYWNPSNDFALAIRNTKKEKETYWNIAIQEKLCQIFVYQPSSFWIKIAKCLLWLIGQGKK